MPDLHLPSAYGDEVIDVAIEHIIRLLVAGRP